MISALTGELRRVEQRNILLQVGPMQLELLVPAADITELQTQIGQEITFHTLFYLEGDASRGNLEPRLIGFLRQADKGFFDKFTTVKGIGPKTALRALSVPAGQIAGAIEAKDARFLTKLDGIGKRTAELIIAELSGKVSAFASVHVVTTGSAERRSTAYSVAEEDAIAAMIQLGERRPDAERLLDRARQAAPTATASNDLLREMLRLRSTRV